MKKLMIAAAAMASVAAFADCDRTQDANCAEVYDVTLNLKTTECVCKLVTTTTSGECGRKSSSSSCEAWRKVVTKKVQGVIFNCQCSCSDEVDGSILDSAILTPAVWNESTGENLSGNQYFWIAKDKVVLNRENDLLTIKWLGRIGQKLNQVEAAGTFQEGITVAGYGAFDTKNDRVKSISGNAAGVWGAPYDCSAEVTEEVPTDYCPAYKMCDDVVLDDFAKTFASGTWSVKYNASKSKAIGSDVSKLWGKVVPAKVDNYTKFATTGDTVYGSQTL